MKTAYLLHGVPDEDEYLREDFPSPSNAHWLPWLQRKFLRAVVLCQALEMPRPFAPTYDEWRTVWEGARLGEDSVIVAHSAGSGFILKWLAENREVRLGRLVLVAPWLDLGRECGDFLVGDLDGSLQERVGAIEVLYSENERVEGVLEGKDIIMRTYPAARLHTFAEYGHFCFGDLGAEFAELWEICSS